MDSFESNPAGEAIASFSMLGSSFTLYQAPGFGSRCILECAIGPPVATELEETLRHYLALNHGLAELGRVGFCIDAGDVQACCVAREDLAEETATSLLDKVRRNWGLKRDRWRETRATLQEDDEGDFDNGKVFSMARVPPEIHPHYA
jgi:hypothetical protein